jgi:L-arabinose isomerase
MKDAPVAGILPFYLKLYDDVMPERRERFLPFLRSLEENLKKRGITSVVAKICRVQSEFINEVKRLESEGVNCIVTVHLAYSPSLESIEALRTTSLPVVVLDTTMDISFGPEVHPDRIMYNHGIHGVMDMTNLLCRNLRPFMIVAGHPDNSNVLDRLAAIIRGAFAAEWFKNTRALRIGEAFSGMGDFNVEPEFLQRNFGIKIREVMHDELERSADSVTEDEIQHEIKQDRTLFHCLASEDAHKRTIRVSLGLRRLLMDGNYTAFSMNFLAFSKSEGSASTVPFLEASKAMARKIGYAGEGDVLTASLVGALSHGFREATFTEIFCPDWHGNSLFISHMGEFNVAVAGTTPLLVEKPFPFTPAKNPVIAVCTPMSGPAIYVNMAPLSDGVFRLIVAPVDVLNVQTTREMESVIRGWIRPHCRIEDFLERYSMYGGTHHSALVWGASIEGLLAMGKFLNLDCKVID